MLGEGPGEEVEPTWLAPLRERVCEVVQESFAHYLPRRNASMNRVKTCEALKARCDRAIADALARAHSEPDCPCTPDMCATTDKIIEEALCVVNRLVCLRACMCPTPPAPPPPEAAK